MENDEKVLILCVFINDTSAECFSHPGVVSTPHPLLSRELFTHTSPKKGGQYGDNSTFRKPSKARPSTDFNPGRLPFLNKKGCKKLMQPFTIKIIFIISVIFDQLNAEA